MYEVCLSQIFQRSIYSLQNIYCLQVSRHHIILIFSINWFIDAFVAIISRWVRFMRAPGYGWSKMINPAGENSGIFFRKHAVPQPNFSICHSPFASHRFWSILKFSWSLIPKQKKNVLIVRGSTILVNSNIQTMQQYIICHIVNRSLCKLSVTYGGWNILG